MLNIDWNPDRRKLRKFGLWLGVLSLLFGGILAARGHGTAGCATGVCGVIAGLLCVFVRPAALVIYRLWMCVSLALGKIVFPLVLGAVFFLIVTPLGILSRLAGRDTLAVRKPRGESMWRDIPPEIKDAESYLRQF
jgi:hypothetical protein